MDKIPINNDKFNSITSFKLKSHKYVKFFINEGIEPHRLVVIGFGENYPIDDTESFIPSKEQKNRDQINYR